ncbi:MAG: proton-conducting transporter membrane subunit [Sulfuricurvum sp.]|nr:proton-conducting transporter membrane subunit [Sulfuricurvum sp.]
MQELLLILFLLPFFAAVGVLSVKRYAGIITFFTATFLMAASSLAYLSFESSFTLSLSYLSVPFLVTDLVLLGYFATIGYTSRNKKILFLSIVQAAFLFLLENFSSREGYDIVVDKLSLFMFLLINIVGSLILIYAVRYIKDETSDISKQAVFLAILTAFLGVMNLLVSVDNIEWLFLFFEMTTLASFWLIGFRDDAESQENARIALWMNQIGGVALLAAALVAKAELHTVYISEILTHGGETLILFTAFFAVAALIKGAQMPFSPWLLGAMAAPTPVSAILHSSTMVKIAPYFILKISPALAGTAVGGVIALIGAISFLVSAALALREENFKKILAYSTISLLGLMILTASLGTPLSVLACMLLILFHGVSKAMLFMCAGVLEKKYHIKSIESVEGLINKAPILTSLIILGFLSISLPPFGVFFAKWIVYEGGAGISGLIVTLLLFFIAVGSVALTLLYFKTVGRFVANDDTKSSKEDYSYLASPLILGMFLLGFSFFISPAIGGFFKENASFVVSSVVPISGDFWGITLPFGRLEFWHIVAAFLLLGVAPLLAAKIRLKGIDKVKPYSCGEKIETSAYSFYFDPAKNIEKVANTVSAALFLLIILLGALNL